MKVLFFGSSNYSIPILESLKNNFVITVFTKTGQAVETFAWSHHIKVFTPANKEELINLKNEIVNLKPDLAVVADYGMIIPKEIFDIPRLKSLNIHFSKLPSLRGPSPVQYTILMGEKSAWISVIIMDEAMDTGEVIWQKEIGLQGDETSKSLYRNLFNIAASELPDIINKYINNDLIPQKQDHSSATYTKHFFREDGFIPADLLFNVIRSPDLIGRRIPSEILKTQGILRLAPPDDLSNLSHLPIFTERACRALSLWPGLWTIVKLPSPKRLKILKAHLEPLASQGPPLQGYRLVIDLVQLEGKKPVTWKQFLAGYPNFKF